MMASYYYFSGGKEELASVILYECRFYFSLFFLSKYALQIFNIQHSTFHIRYMYSYSIYIHIYMNTKGTSLNICMFTYLYAHIHSHKHTRAQKKVMQFNCETFDKIYIFTLNFIFTNYIL